MDTVLAHDSVVNHAMAQRSPKGLRGCILCLITLGWMEREEGELHCMTAGRHSRRCLQASGELVYRQTWDMKGGVNAWQVGGLGGGEGRC